MQLLSLGWNTDLESHYNQAQIPGCIPGRVCEENREFYKVVAESGELLASITGRIRFHAESRADYPSIGDWVLIQPRIAENRGTIEMILPRKTILSRKMAGKHWKEQIIACNVDTIFIVTSLNHELNLRRIERYLAIAWESGCQPVVVLNKADLHPDTESVQHSVEQNAPMVPIHCLSGLTGAGLSQLRQYLPVGRTAVFVGSSGVGKSTLINALLGRELQRVQPIRDSDHEGKHTTTNRQMLLLPGGGIVIDTPGMREIGMWENEEGISRTFQDIEELATRCRFRDCKHNNEPGCAVKNSVEDGSLETSRLESYRKLEAELQFQERKTNIAMQQETKARAKRIGRWMKKVYKERE